MPLPVIKNGKVQTYNEISYLFFKKATHYLKAITSSWGRCRLGSLWPVGLQGRREVPGPTPSAVGSRPSFGRSVDWLGSEGKKLIMQTSLRSLCRVCSCVTVSGPQTPGEPSFGVGERGSSSARQLLAPLPSERSGGDRCLRESPSEVPVAMTQNTTRGGSGGSRDPVSAPRASSWAGSGRGRAFSSQPAHAPAPGAASEADDGLCQEDKLRRSCRRVGFAAECYPFARVGRQLLTLTPVR